MKYLGLLLALVLTAASNPSIASSKEPFKEFLARFASEPEFRSQRIADPLSIRIGNEALSEVASEKLPAARAVALTAPLLSETVLVERGLRQRISRVSGSTMEVFQYRDEADSYLVTFRFELRGGKWFLTSFCDDSM